jgi:hypothetical protein
MDIDFNTKCYTIEKKTYQKGIFDESVDATYIIHLKDNGRYPHISEQLQNFQPTKKVYIVLNEGFKNCNKKLIEQISYQDLTDAFLQCFTHADDKGYNNILILEDDFIFSEELKKDKSHIYNINQFLLKQPKNESFIYYLGCNPILIRPATSCFSHYRSYKSCSTHAIIYSKAARSTPLNLDLKHWDTIVEAGIPNRYLYCKPLCYQTYPDTENKQTWSEKDNIFIGYLKNQVIQCLNLDKQPEPGFTILYLIAKILNILVLLVILAIIYFIGAALVHIAFNMVSKSKTQRRL